MMILQSLISIMLDVEGEVLGAIKFGKLIIVLVTLKTGRFERIKNSFSSDQRKTFKIIIFIFICSS